MQLAKNLAVLGVDISPGFLAQAVKGEDATYSLTAGEAAKANKRSLDDDLGKVLAALRKGENPFLRSADEYEGEVCDCCAIIGAESSAALFNARNPLLSNGSSLSTFCC